jgi:hypothetical protein
MELNLVCIIDTTYSLFLLFELNYPSYNLGMAIIP